jgi:catechol 2,3-dioxygenase-like lactoylglutathione lyase family enzyme
MIEANLTRFGPEHYAAAQSGEAPFSAGFTAIEGPATLVLRVQDLSRLSIGINSVPVVELKDIRGLREVAIPLTLEKENTIDVFAAGASTGSVEVRVTQLTQADIGIVRQGYFGLNTSDMARQRAFYGLLGFKGEIFPAGPETSTTFARSLGFEDDYLIYVSLHSLEDPPTMPFVDTVQFRGSSFRDEPPYATLNHLGMAYATYSTTNLDGDHAWLSSRGVEFVSAPVTAPNGERFVFMKDPDGAFLKLISTNVGDVRTDGPNLKKLVNTNMNVSDLERSREFYRLLGFTESLPGAVSCTGDYARAHGFDGPIEFDGVDVSLGAGTDGATLQLRQWKRPYDDAPPYPPPVNHLGIDRVNFYVKDLTAAIRTMTELGFKPLGPVGGPPEFGIVFFFDPDGIKVQLAGPRTA